MVLIFGIALTLVVMIGDIHGGFGTIMDTLTTGHKFMFQNEVWMSPDIISTSVFIVFIFRMSLSEAERMVPILYEQRYVFL